MSYPTWSHSGRILFNASRVYYVPDEPCLPPLRWMPELQRFEYLSKENDEDVSLRESLTELAEAYSQLYQLQPVQQQLPAASLSGYLPCEALYGVLPLGAESNSALLYVTEKEYVCTLCVGSATHDVFAVRRLQWLFLPCATSALSGRRQNGRCQRYHRGSPRSGNRSGGAGGGMSDDADGDTDGNEYGQARSNSCSGDFMSETDEEEDDNAENESYVMERLPTKTLYDYLAVLNRFCESINADGGGQQVSGAADVTASRNDKGELQKRASQLPGIVGPPNRFSYLYYSPTLDLSADPVHLLALITHTAHPHVDDGTTSTGGRATSETTNGSLSSNPNREGSGMTTDLSDQPRLSKRALQSAASHLWEERRAAAVTRQLYQWNGPLVGDAFALPTLAVLRKEYASERTEACKEPSPCGESRLEPWSCVCADELLRDKLTQCQQRGGYGGGAVSLAASTAPATAFSSLPLYIPSYIRGLVAQTEASPSVRMTLVTRLCCRWAGTRYNRRGLEPGHSGVVANMAMSSLWVTPQSRKSATSLTEKSETTSDARSFAVYSMLRGSVPRRWEQPANLSLRPTIKIAPAGSAAEDLGRHVRLLKQCLPHLHTLYCLDTMSSSELEEPLSEAFAAAVRRYNEDLPSASTTTKSGTYPFTSSVGATAEEKDGTVAALTVDNGEESVGAANTPTRDPIVSLVKYNAGRDLRRLSYAAMMRECIAKLDCACGADTWLDFTKGEAYAPRTGVDKVAMGGVQSGLQSSNLTGTEDDSGHRDTAPRLLLAHVQSRLVRVNCLDCLDRTNLVQSMLCCAALPQMIDYVEGTLQERHQTPTVTERSSLSQAELAEASYRLRLLFAAQGMAISQLYAGTKPHFVPYMLNGCYRWSHGAVEGALSLRRWYQQNFFDGVKQDEVSLVTRQHDPQVFNADIESPFSRDLSGMNQQVLYGILLGVMPFLYSLTMCVRESRGFSSFVFQLHFGICVCWMVYLSVLYSKLMRYRVTYTNRPLLLYTRQADWC
ncbi:SacI homology domain containing protein, putative [Leishmania lindenbergi]|uniref:SacIy domain containing protein n=1 Tax=Leishmania lindenbergi TaxID=651832 RepID=A0AAW2ZXH4_9TRYP